MIPNTRDRVVETHGVAQTGEFGISYADSAHIMTILRDTLYSDKVLAVLREYSSNAWDAHREIGKADLPIKITLPTAMDQTLTIRDFGPGLSQQDVFEVYTQYGASTKRNSDSTVGMLGIGSKSGFAYSDSFTIVSHHGGMKRTYVAVLDESEKGIINLLHEEPSDETGVLIQMAVRPSDMDEFYEKSKTIFQYFVPRPDINLVIPPLPTTQIALEHGVIYDRDDVEWHRTGWVAVMGCVPYRVNLEQLKVKGGEHNVGDFLGRMSGALFFNIGEVQISASREELKYSDSTKKALAEKFEALVDEFVQQSLDGILNGGFNPWEKRVRAQSLGRLNLPLADMYKSLVDPSVKLVDSPKSIVFEHGKHVPSSIYVSEETRIILRDDHRPLAGYHLRHYDYVVRRTDKKIEWDAIRAELDTYFAQIDITGIPILKNTEMPWVAKLKSEPEKKQNEMYYKKSFQLAENCRGYNPHSVDWKPIKRKPTKSDVFAVIYEFRAVGFDIFNSYQNDQVLGEIFNKKIPPVYGYKTTSKKPLENKDCIGTAYLDWRTEFTQSLLTKRVKRIFNFWEWYQTCNNWHMPKRKNYTEMVAKLGKHHPISNYIRRFLIARDYFQKHEKMGKAMEVLRKRVGEAIAPPADKKKLDAIFERYPLFTLSQFEIHQLWGDESDKWIEYIKLVDQIRKEEHDHRTAVHPDERIDHSRLAG